MSMRYYVNKEEDEYQIIDSKGLSSFQKCNDEKCIAHLCSVLNLYHNEIEQSNMVLEDYLAELKELKIKIEEKKGLFEGVDKDHYNRWVTQIREYVDLKDADFIIKLSLSYTLQALRNGKSLKEFQWEYEGE